MLFHRLLHLLSNGSRRAEDVFTEIVAAVLTHHPDVFYGWVGDQQGPDDRFVVETQRSFTRLAENEPENRPDLMITRHRDGDVILYAIESKIGSSEGRNQLPRYAAVLERERKAGRCVRWELWYVTRDYDPKTQPIECEAEHACFRERRWYELAPLLRPYHADPLIAETLAFMNALDLNNPRHLTPEDLAAFRRFQRLYAFANEVLSGRVAKAFGDFTGNRNASFAKGFAGQLGRHNRAVLTYNVRGKISSVAGLVLDGEDGYPLVEVQLEINTPGEERRAFERAASSQFSKAGWERFTTHDPHFVAYRSRKSIADFLACSDHVEAIQDWCTKQFEHLVAFKAQYPELAWASGQQNVEEDE